MRYDLISSNLSNIFVIFPSFFAFSLYLCLYIYLLLARCLSVTHTAHTLLYHRMRFSYRLIRLFYILVCWLFNCCLMIVWRDLGIDEVVRDEPTTADCAPHSQPNFFFCLLIVSENIILNIRLSCLDAGTTTARARATSVEARQGPQNPRRHTSI